MGNEQKILQAAKLIKNSKHTVALTGAGVSTPSGIPDFRSPGSGLWEKHDPMEVASIWGFNAHPETFYEWMRPMSQLMAQARPNPAHTALAELEDLGLIRAIITQNIDGLHQDAGSKRVLEVHGHTRAMTCIRCFHQCDAKPLTEKFLADGAVPICQVCGGVLKPNVVLFGEMMPVSVMFEAEQETKKCDIVLVAGSSLEVAPAGDLPLVAKKNGAKIIIVNKGATVADAHAAIVIREDVASALPKIVEQVKRG
ncbi:MAG: NAD-dependent deacylase [Chloroflexi bacterium]|nr:NAD-dependent deacylase [Chloroflexota bacterium]